MDPRGTFRGGVDAEGGDGLGGHDATGVADGVDENCSVERVGKVAGIDVGGSDGVGGGDGDEAAGEGVG